MSVELRQTPPKAPKFMLLGAARDDNKDSAEQFLSPLGSGLVVLKPGYLNEPSV